MQSIRIARVRNITLCVKFKCYDICQIDKTEIISLTTCYVARKHSIITIIFSSHRVRLSPIHIQYIISFAD